MVHIHVGQNLSDGGGVRNVVVPGAPVLALMGLTGVGVGVSDEANLLVAKVG